jgi:hypothetical protein
VPVEHRSLGARKNQRRGIWLNLRVPGEKHRKGKLSQRDNANAVLAFWLIEVSVVFRYVKYAVSAEDEESEDWLLSAYRIRHTKMQGAFEKQSQALGTRGNVIQIGSGHEQAIALHSTPDSFSIPESRKFAAYVFDDEVSARNLKDMGRLHFIAVFGNVTETQIRRHLGNFEAAEVFKADWGYFGMEPNTGIQAIYLQHCTNSLIMQARMSEALEWLTPRAEKIAMMAFYRQQLLDLSQSRTAPGAKKAATSATKRPVIRGA